MRVTSFIAGQPSARAMGLYLSNPNTGYNCAMPKVNVYLPDDLADAVRDTGVPVSAICQRALEHAVRRVTAIRQTVLGDLTDADLAERLPSYTERARTVLSLARDAGPGPVGTGRLLRAMLDEGGNLALQVLDAMEVPAGDLADGLARSAADEPPTGPGLRFSVPAANALELAVSEATALGHNYVGCEHLLIGLAAEPDGVAGRVLRATGADPKGVRRAVSAALAMYAHLRARTAPAATAALVEVVRQELAPLVRRIEALESRAA
jgi:ATP-dependent Clp protease ATP-binding subunit ClpC